MYDYYYLRLLFGEVRLILKLFYPLFSNKLSEFCDQALILFNPVYQFLILFSQMQVFFKKLELG